MAVIKSQASSINILKTILPDTAQELTLRSMLKLHKSNFADLKTIRCWGIKANKGDVINERMFKKIDTNCDEVLLFENEPATRVFFGKVIGKEDNLALGRDLWGDDWQYIYYLDDVKTLPITKRIIYCDILNYKNMGRFRQSFINRNIYGGYNSILDLIGR